MTPINKQFVLLPSDIALTKEGLHYKDLLTYITIRSFLNSKNDLCMPSYESIADRSGMSKKFIGQSIIRLERAGYLKVERSQKRRASNRYSFRDHECFCQIPYEFFEIDDLTANEKAMLLGVRECFDSTNLEFFVGDLANAALMLDVTYRTVYVQFKSLIDKGYIEKVTIPYKSGGERKVTRLTSKINWHYHRDIKPEKLGGDQDSSNLIFK
ncbi:helix-turn-helix protein [Mucilaginibacter yixingensis]|uniref:Helix-turn-helix protein n=1 Tax=Mucilaginibacter yixingensis TaxID=1295612 RepID=A0A2T5J9V0_9SPHI|nr:helix-turn-helix domain-containing protein [Mucilaginibacter yixingensis]PTQ96838.1 helix-turn-helix protein [Mucilaginibacter yixingensis]